MKVMDAPRGSFARGYLSVQVGPAIPICGKVGLRAAVPAVPSDEVPESSYRALPNTSGRPPCHSWPSRPVTVCLRPLTGRVPIPYAANNATTRYRAAAIPTHRSQRTVSESSCLREAASTSHSAPPRGLCAWIPRLRCALDSGVLLVPRRVCCEGGRSTAIAPVKIGRCMLRSDHRGIDAIVSNAGERPPARTWRTGWRIHTLSIITRGIAHRRSRVCDVSDEARPECTLDNS